MSTLSWNYCGLELSRHVHELKALVNCFQQSFLFLSETKILSSFMLQLRVCLGFSSGTCVDNVGSKGGLALFWNSSDTISLQSFSIGHIDILIHSSQGNTWHMMGFYGNPIQDQRIHSW